MFASNLTRFSPAAVAAAASAAPSIMDRFAAITSPSQATSTANSSAVATPTTMSPVSTMKVQVPGLRTTGPAFPSTPLTSGPSSPFAPAPVSNGPANPFSTMNITSSLEEAHNKNFAQLKQLQAINEPEAPALRTDVATDSETGSTKPMPLSGMQMQRFFRFDQAFNHKKSKDDIVLSTEETHGVFTFNTFRGITNKKQLADALLSVPVHLRRYHCVTGIMSQPIDFYADLDIPRDLTELIPCESLLKMVIHIVHDKLKDIKLTHQHTLVLESKGAKHLSFHMHIRCSNGVFEDFAVIRPLADEVNAEFARQVKKVYDQKDLPVPEELLTFSPLDTAVYRRCGQVRIGHCVKIARPEAPLACYQPKDEGLKKLLQSTLGMSIQEHVDMSIPLRLSSENFGITIKQGKTHGVDGAGIGRKIPPRMHESKKADRFRDACAQIKRYPPEFAREYNTWVCVGCALYSFGPEFREQALDVWMGFSRKCGEKFKPTSIRRYWDHSFRGGSNGTAIDDNWRRGYYYCVSTIYGQNHRANKVKAPTTEAAAGSAAPAKTTSTVSASKSNISEL